DRRVHVVERPLVRRELAVRVHVPLGKQQRELLLGEVWVDQREWDAMEGEVPGREPRIFPRVRHREHLGGVEVPPARVPAALALGRWRGAGGIAVEPLADVVAVELFGPEEARERLALNQRGVRIARVLADLRVELVALLAP